MFGGIDDDVAALEMDGLAAPSGGKEQFRPFIDIHSRSVGELQHCAGSRTGADRISFADGRTCLDGACRYAEQTAFSRNDSGWWTSRGHDHVDTVAPDIHERD